MAQALYRKYRPRSFEGTVGQDYITKTLKRAIKSGRISHAYLFAGPRGVGKTSVARILAHEINGLPYTGDAFHLDIIEIDAASNRRIDEIRDLRDKVHISPALAKYKIYIIDEVHMLTKEAFNALLKTLEEPPEHCIFILATTEAHKLPETIISRTQRFDFKPIGTKETARQLQTIAKAEKIDINLGAIELLAQYGEGSLREIIGMLDQLGSSDKKIDSQDVRDLLGLPPQTAINKLADEIIGLKLKSALASLETLKDQGVSPMYIARDLSVDLRRRMINNEISGDWPSGFLRQLVEISGSSNPQEMIELAVIESASRPASPEGTQTPLLAKVHSSSTTSPVLSKKNQGRKLNDPGQSKGTDEIENDWWTKVLDLIRNEAPSLYTALRLAKPSVSDGKLDLVVRFPLHQKKILVAKNKHLIASAFQEITGSPVEVGCSVNKVTRFSEKTVTDAPDMRTISNIFGSAEVLES